MRAALLKQLIAAHGAGDDSAFRKAALQLASSERQAGHERIADEIRQLVDSLEDGAPRPNHPVSLARPSRELAGLLEGGYSEFHLRDIILTAEAGSQFRRVISENRQRSKLESWGVAPSRKLLWMSRDAGQMAIMNWQRSCKPLICTIRFA